MKRAEVPPAEYFSGCPGGCLSAVCVLGLGPGLVAVCSFPLLGAGWRSRGPWPLPSWLAAALSSWLRLLYWLSWERATSLESFPSFHCPCSTGASISRVYSYAGTYRGLLPLPHSFADFWQSVSTRFQPTGGVRWKNLRVQSGLSVEVYVSFYVSLVSAFASIVRLFQPTV